MLFLLRNIRRKLLGSKVSSYLLYAVGEIFLVVVGILIAVSIDDWNQSKTDKKNEIRFYRKLYSDALDDSLFFSNRKEILHRSDSTLRVQDGELPIPTDFQDTVKGQSALFLSVSFYSKLMDNQDQLLERTQDTTIEKTLRRFIRDYNYCTGAVELFNDFSQNISVQSRIHFPEMILSSYNLTEYRIEVLKRPMLAAFLNGRTGLLRNFERQIDNIIVSNAQLLNALREKPGVMLKKPYKERPIDD